MSNIKATHHRTVQEVSPVASRNIWPSQTSWWQLLTSQLFRMPLDIVSSPFGIGVSRQTLEHGHVYSGDFSRLCRSWLHGRILFLLSHLKWFLYEIFYLAQFIQVMYTAEGKTIDRTLIDSSEEYHPPFRCAQCINSQVVLTVWEPRTSTFITLWSVVFLLNLLAIEWDSNWQNFINALLSKFNHAW